MAAPMKYMFFRKIWARHHVKILSKIRKSSSLTNTKSTIDDNEDRLTIRAQKKRKAFEQYQKRYNVEKPWDVKKTSSNKSKYYIENGLRKVYPYYDAHCSYTKGRWCGRTILDVCLSLRNEVTNYVQKIEQGTITVNDKIVPVDFVLRDGMRIIWHFHRHEVPVLNEPIEVIHETDELLVINKPTSIPVHPCGKYGFNSIIKLLEYEHGYTNLRVLHRLDRLTSGLLILVKSLPLARQLVHLMESKQIHKEYVCRVEGKFPEGEVICDEPVTLISNRLCIHGVDAEGKPSLTSFTRLSYNGKTSVVKCVPHTGRTHQIRVHLQFLGYPVCNDPVYNNTAFGPGKGKGGIQEKTLQEIEEAFLKTPADGREIKSHNPKYFRKFGNKRSKDSSIKVEDLELEGNSTMLSCSSGENLKQSRAVVTEKIGSMAKSDELEINGDLENVTEDSDDLSKTIPIDSNPGKNVIVCDTVVNKVGSCDVEQFGNVNDVKENCAKLNSDGRTDKSAEFKKNSVTDENSNNDKDEFVTDPHVVDSKIQVDESCPDCKYIYEDPKPKDLIMYLHAVRYKGPDWEFTAPLPQWAAEDFDVPNSTVT